MASIISHSFVGYVFGKIFYSQETRKNFWFFSLLCPIIPDFDGIGFKLGIPYNHFLGHRGFTHSFLFAALLSIIIVYFFFKKEKRFSSSWFFLVGYFFLITATHSLLDACTTGGLGVAFFSPFDTTRYFFPWRVIKVSPIGITQFFSEWGIRVILSELLWVWFPLTSLLVIKLFFKKIVLKNK